MNKLILFFTLFITVQTFAATETLKFQKDKGHVSFLAVGQPSALKIRGEGTGAEGNLKLDGKQASGTLKFNVSSLKTGIEMRDEHMQKKYLKSDVNPEAVLKIAKAPYKQQSKYDMDVPAELTLNKVTKPVSVHVHVDNENDKTVKGTSDFTIKLSDFQIEIPKYLGITVAEDVKVDVDFDAAVERK